MIRKLYNVYVKGNKRGTEKNYITKSRKILKKLEYFPDKVHIIYCKKKNLKIKGLKERRNVKCKT